MNVNISFKDFLEIFKLPPSIASYFVIASGTILFSPDSFIKKLYLYDFKIKYGFWIGLIFVISSVILIVLIVGYLIEKITSPIKNKKLKEARTKLLLEFDHDKVSKIRWAIRAKDNTICLPINNGTTQILQHYSILTPASGTNIVDENLEINYFLQPWVIDLIKNNKDLSNMYI